MGLDNIPATYPCQKAGTSIENTIDNGEGGTYQRIDSDATQAAGGCPWAVASQGRGTGVTGMMGTDCWYRGKVGTYMLERLDRAGFPCPVEGGFYGPDSETLPPDYCRSLGRWMAEHIEAYAMAVRSERLAPEQERIEIDEFRYAAWWLTWIAEAGDGAKAWW